MGWVVAGVFSGALTVMAVSNHSEPYSTAGTVATAVCLAVAAACAVRAACAAHGRRRFGWTALVVALLAWAVGEFLPEGTWSSRAVLLLFPVAAYAALLLLADLDKAPRRRLVLDGTIVMTSLFVVSWVIVLRNFTGNDGVRVFTAGHVAIDAILMTTAVLVWARPLHRPSVSLIAAGITTIAASDIAAVYAAGIGGYHSGHFADMVRMAGVGISAFAALLSVDDREVQTSALNLQPGARVWLPYLPLLLAGIAGMSYERSQHSHFVLLGAEGILLAAVLLRQFVVLLENQRLLAEVSREAFHDHLTGLANRPNFLDKLDRAVTGGRRDAGQVAVLCLDLDNFKAVNDALGHPAGDELLIRVAGRLTETLGRGWTIARLGGDEFAALTEGRFDALAAAHRVLDAFSTPIVIDGVPQLVRPSIGLTVADGATKPSTDDMLLNADLAMYAAKRDGGGCVRSFVPELPAPWELEQPANSSVEQHDSLITTQPDATSGDGRRTVKDAIRTSRWPSPKACAALGVLALGVLVFTVSTFIREPGRNVVFDSVLYPALNAGAAALVFARAFRVPAERWSCLLIGAGMASSAAGDIVYALQAPEGTLPSMADVLYLAFYPLVYAGMVLLMRDRLKRVPTVFRIDSLICGLSLGAVAAALATGRIDAALHGGTAGVLVGLAYPLGDLLLLALAAGMLPILGWRAELRWALLVVGFMAYAVADTVYLFQTSAGTYLEGTWIDACWPIASLLVALAGWMPSSRVHPRPMAGLASYVPAVVCASVALAVAILANQSRIAVTLAALTLIAVAWRFAVTFRDVSATADAHRQAMTDELTGLPNRLSLATTLTAVTTGEPTALFRTRSSRALLLLDIDQFSEINDFAGRNVGDQLLIGVAERLRRTSHPDDVIARTGGDEFAILVADGVDVTSARARAGTLLEALRAPFQLDPLTVQVDGCISIALCPEHCEHPGELLSCVEMTMPHAKDATGRIAVYDASRLRLEKDNDDYLVEELRTALSSDELTCYYQPKICADDGSVHSVEALLRWQHPRRGLLLPEEFLPVAERAGLMRQVAHCAINLALGQVRAWCDQGLAVTVAVNLSMANLLDLDLVDTIERLLATHNVSPNALILEITEGTFANDSSRSRKTVFALRRIGVRISLDDYGTGWSSLARLQNLSVDELKLDRVFVSRLAENPRSIAIVRSTVALAHSLGADLVAEGVEDEATLRALRRYGCTITQGFVHTPPLPADELLNWINTCTPQSSRADLALHPDLR